MIGIRNFRQKINATIDQHSICNSIENLMFIKKKKMAWDFSL